MNGKTESSMDGGDILLQSYLIFLLIRVIMIISYVTLNLVFHRKSDSPDNATFGIHFMMTLYYSEVSFSEPWVFLRLTSRQHFINHQHVVKVNKKVLACSCQILKK